MFDLRGNGSALNGWELCCVRHTQQAFTAGIRQKLALGLVENVFRVGQKVGLGLS